MSYNPVNWANGEEGGTPMSASNLNRMDKGIADAHEILAEHDEKIDDFANQQLPEEYVKSAVDTYIEENEAGLALKEEVEALDAKIDAEVSSLSSEIVEVKNDLKSGLIPFYKGSTEVEISSADFARGTIYNDGSFHSEVTYRICTENVKKFGYDVSVTCNGRYMTLLYLYEGDTINASALDNSEKVIPAFTPFKIVIVNADISSGTANIGEFFNGVNFTMDCKTLEAIESLKNGGLNDDSLSFSKLSESAIGVPKGIALSTTWHRGYIDLDYGTEVANTIRLHSDIETHTHYNYKIVNPDTSVYKFTVAYRQGTTVLETFDMTNLADYTLAFPKNCDNWFISIGKNDNSEILPIEGDLFVISVGSAVNSIADVVKAVGNSNKLYGKKMCIIGDSYVAGLGIGMENTWSAIIARKNTMIYKNYGISGNAITTTKEGVTDGEPMMNRYTEMDNDADYVIVVGGKNDYNCQIDLETFRTRFTQFLENMCNKYVGKKLFFFTPWRISLNNVEDLFGEVAKIPLMEYVKVIEEVCELHSVPCFNSAKQSNIWMWNANFRATYCMTSTDISHLNVEGQKLMVDNAEAFLLSH